VLVLRNVSFSYDYAEEQVRDVSLTIKRGEFVVLTGVSGCGKTSLTRLMNGLIPHFYEGKLSGDVLLLEKNTREMHSWEFGQVVGSIFQDPRSQFFASIVQDEIAFGCENYGIPAEEIQSRLSEAVQAIAVESLLQSNLSTISNGERQKVAVAAVRAMRPQIYVMDEPSANLDGAATQDLRRILAQLKSEGFTIIVAEHRLLYVMDLADRILYMQDGRVTQEFTPQEIKRLPREQLGALGLRSPAPLTGHLDQAVVSGETSEILAASNIQKCVGREKRPLLRNVSFRLRRGEVVALTGANGAGKTTLARILCGLTRENGGTVLFGGNAVRPGQRARHAWFVMQDTDTQLFMDTVLNEVILGKEATPALLAKAEQILTHLDLWQYRERHPASLSGGQKQRLSIAVALVQDTQIVIFDEPTSGLDGRNMRRVSEIIRQAARNGKTVLIITHDEEFMASSCNRVMQLKNGVCHAESLVETSQQS
jgi:energy-coupling factor transport system ATP-binding protein